MVRGVAPMTGPAGRSAGSAVFVLDKGDEAVLRIPTMSKCRLGSHFVTAKLRNVRHLVDATSFRDPHQGALRSSRPCNASPSRPP
jgi:hypothetical protein